VFTADPTEDVRDAAVPRLLRDVVVDVGRPDSVVARLLGDIRTLTTGNLAQFDIAAVAAEIDMADVATLRDLRELRLPGGNGQGRTIMEVAGTAAFRREYRELTDSWLKLILTDPAAESILGHEDLLRIAHLMQMIVDDPRSLGEPGAIRHLRGAQVVPPPAWRPSHHRVEEVHKRHQATLAAMNTGDGASDRAKAIAQAMLDYKELVRRRELMESIQIKANYVYVEWKRNKLAELPRPTATTVRRPGLLGRVSAFLWGSSSALRRPRAGQPLLKLDDQFYTGLDSSLTNDERDLYAATIGSLPRPDTHGALDAELAPEQWLGDANRICHQIKLWQDAELQELPDAPAGPAGQERPLVRAIGWGDLVVARERLIGYAAREVAHIENVMTGESKVREHERRRTVEQVIETETLEETESERDLQTTDRYELQSEAQTTIEEEYSIQAGLNTSGRYGLTQVNTSLQVGLQQNKTEARSSAQTLAREVISKAVERTFERVRELRRQTITEQIRELNYHGLQNLAGAGNGGPPPDVSGIYLWVEKLLEVELRHYGTRMLVEFHIPEPAVTLLERRANPGPQPRKPAPFTLSPTDVEPENYMCLTSTYGAQDVVPPPPQEIRVGYAWATTPSEEAEAWGQDTRADLIAIPNRYRPVAMTALVSAHPPTKGWDAEVDVFMALGGEIVVEMTGGDYGESGQEPGGDPNEGGPVEIDFDPALTWPGGVPIVVRAAGHFDKSLVAEATVRCIRTDDALDDWRLRTWEQLRSAHELLMQTYRTEVEEQALSTFGTPPLERPEAENRRIEADELRKWAVKAMRLQKNDFNGIIAEDDGFQEIDPLNADLLASVAEFFEEAFEWPQASHFLYPYYWSRRDTWKLRTGLTAVDPRHAAFLQAGSARFIVPVTPGFEEHVVFYLESDAEELDRLAGPPDTYEPDSEAFKDFWLEILLDRRPELGLGSGTLNVHQGNEIAAINDDSNWVATFQDIGRELYIDGDQYSIVSVAPKQVGAPQEIELDEPYIGVDNPAAAYATGSVPYGPPWVARVPTSLVILNGRRQDLAQLGT
jgi:hypothetical protein